MVKSMTTEEVRAMWIRSVTDERAMLLEDVALPIAEERDRLAAELAEVKAVLARVCQKIKAIVPYVSATIGPGCRTNTRAEWCEIHRGRADSSLRQLNVLMSVTNEAKR